ncbi:MAG: FliM/FliN family flagellar motor switch protein [Pseudomonadota bacterium]
MAEEDVLTEGEIDALMESVDDGAEGIDASDDGEYRRVDFSARERSLLRAFATMEPLLERQAELLTSALESQFSIEFQIRAQPLELKSVGDVLASLERAVAVSTARLNPLSAAVFTVAPMSLLSFTVNAYFGGGIASASEERESLTPTELRIAERMAEHCLLTLVEAWQEKLPLELSDLDTLGVADRLEALPASDVVLRFAFSFAVDEFESHAEILIPFDGIEPFQERFAPPRRKQETVEGEGWAPHLRSELPGIELELAAVLSSFPISLADLLELEEGSVLPLAPPEQVGLKVDDVTLAEGRYGTFEGLKAVQLQRLGDPDS